MIRVSRKRSIVKAPQSGKSYHKGNLREKLIREAARTVAVDGLKQLSMRKLSGRLEISRTAAYHHFKSKEELLSVVAETGFTQLAGSLEEVRRTAGTDPRVRLKAAAMVYARFARDERDIFRLMFASAVERKVMTEAGPPEVNEFAFSSPAASGAFEELHRLVRECREVGVLPAEDDLVLANMIWAFVHGASELRVNDQLKIRGGLDDFLCRSIDVLLAGGGPRVARRSG